MTKKLDYKLIDALPVCDDGKKAVQKLIEGLGVEVEKRREPASGEVWYCDEWIPDTYYVIASGVTGNPVALNINNRLASRVDLASLERTKNKKFIAPSLEEFYRMKFAGEIE